MRPVIRVAPARWPVGGRRRGHGWLVGGNRSKGLASRAGLAPRQVRGIVGPAVEGFPPTRQFPELIEGQALLAALNPQIDCLRRANHALGGFGLSASEPLSGPTGLRLNP